MLINVRCRCAVQRQIDTATVGPWRLRCKTCQEIIYDPTPPAPPPGKPRPPDPITTDEEQTQFKNWLEGSAELKVLMSSDNDPKNQPNCKDHPKYKIVAACSKCAKLLCKRCLDRVGDSFTCSACVAKQLEASDERAPGGFLAFLRRLLGRR